MQGIAASPGIAIGRVFLKAEDNIEFKEKTIDDIEKELKRLSIALENAKIELKKLMEETSEKLGQKEAEVFEAHLMLVDDLELIEPIKEKIKDEKINAEAAIAQTINFFSQMFAELDDEYIKAREADIKDVGKRLIRILSGQGKSTTELEENTIVVAIDLSPSDTAQLDTAKVFGFVTQEGSRTSHTAIMARSLGIPAVVGVGKELSVSIKQGRLVSGQTIIVDGNGGQVFINPDFETEHEYQQKREKYQQEQERLKKYKNKEALSKDGKKVEVCGNIGNIRDIESILEYGGQGIGLFRTEFLYMDRDTLPSEKEQFEVYRQVAEKMDGKPVVIRTLDIGGDKELPCLNLPKEMNPFLGYRAIRICLDQPDIFKTQLKAILAASNYGNIKIMYPMVSSVDEVKSANRILWECKKELAKEGKGYSQDLEVGIMVEVPAAVMEADIIAQEVDFFSIGTNDLIQYTIAVDRVNEKVAQMYTPYHPAVLKLIKKTIDSAHQAGIWVGMCGEAAADELLLPFLLGVGLDEFSMSAVSILRIKELLSKWTVEEADEISKRVLKLQSAEKIKKFLLELAR
ncbi:phosphoenolpyruvate--protein phosphotransferase [Iocasia frigidifontis]|uniref:Phosphoenolpyruvate-protein phosphotransferase n=1 Tax=Iocasia fonsfrigidae TaxID=2682810 RepID=A0A8A7K8W6_9FIRM|nr:phosphoenolpyruvate--protein phosphotransferase [Iocasia fonsfrigidae]QTL97650.1 phosphoenolpyruvate--protein phosphotransferase [Iocasia fonsfrigidae]